MGWVSHNSAGVAMVGYETCSSTDICRTARWGFAVWVQGFPCCKWWGVLGAGGVRGKNWSLENSLGDCFVRKFLVGRTVWGTVLASASDSARRWGKLLHQAKCWFLYTE